MITTIAVVVVVAAILGSVFVATVIVVVPIKAGVSVHWGLGVVSPTSIFCCGIVLIVFIEVISPAPSHSAILKS